MNLDQTINANVAQCIKTASSFGETKIYNICNGAVSSVPWGRVDWVGAILLGSFVAIMLVLMVLVASLLIKTLRD